MEDHKKEILCGLCLSTQHNENYKEISEAITDILNSLLIKLYLDKKSKSVICNNCSEKLYAAFDFKSTCVYTNNVISTYANCTDLKIVDLKEVYLSEKVNEQSVTLSEDQKVCRLCLDVVEDGFKPLHEVGDDILHIFVPKADVNVKKDPIICKSCLTSLTTHSNFIKSCLKSTEIKFKQDQTKSSHVDLCIKTEDIEIKSEDQELNQEKSVDDHNQLKSTPELTIKLKWYKCEDCDYKTKYKHDLKKHLLFHKDSSEVEWHKCDACDYKTKYRSDLKKHDLRHTGQSEVQWYQCDDCGYKTKQKRYLKSHIRLNHKYIPGIEIYECDKCEYKTQRFSHLERHGLVHKVQDELGRKIRIINEYNYACDKCAYKAKQKKTLQKHMLVHMDSSKWFKCEVCDYKTAKRNNLNRHELIHKDRSEIQWFECDQCDYKAKLKGDLKRHKFRHHNTSMCGCGNQSVSNLGSNELVQVPSEEVKTESLENVDIKTEPLDRHTNSEKVIHNLKIEPNQDHNELLERNIKCEMSNEKIYECKIEPVEISEDATDFHLCKTSEKEAYKCKTNEDYEPKCACTCKPKIKRKPKVNAPQKKTPSKMQWHGCDECDYKTKEKSYLTRHKLIHKDISQVNTYKCKLCEYQAKRMLYLKRHMLTHRSPSEIRWYKCGLCAHKSKHLNSYQMHMKSHADTALWYKCESCDYKTIRRRHLESHMTQHKDPSEIHWYKCDVCDHKTKQLSDLRRHKLKHKDISEVKTFKCDVCSYQTKYIQHLKRHVVQHKDALESQ